MSNEILSYQTEASISFTLSLNLVLPVDEYLLPSIVNPSFVAIAFSQSLGER